MTAERHQSDWQRDLWTAAGLFLLTLLSRIPFRSRILYHWDSVNFAFAMREFSVAKEQPQPPGYIVYVWLCRLVDLLLGDAQATMVWISVVSSALAVAVLFLLARAMFHRRIALIAAVFLAVSPLFWFYGEIALPHTLDTLLVLIAVWWLLEVMQGDPRYLYPAVAATAIAGGVRQQTLLFLAPLLLFAVRKVGWRRFVVSGVLGATLCLVWFVPLIVSSGGLPDYLAVMGAFSRRFQTTTSILMGAGWEGVAYNLHKLAVYTLYGWSVALVPCVAYAAGRFLRREWPLCGERLGFLALWVLPAVVFYTFIHMGQQGLVFVFLPLLLLLAAVGLDRLLAARHRWLIAATMLTATLMGGVFVLVPEYPLGTGTQRLLTRAALVNSDRYYGDRFAAIGRDMPSASTAILAVDWHHVEHYLPEYKLIPVDVIPGWGVDGRGGSKQQNGVHLSAADLGLVPDADGGVRIVIFDVDLAPFNDTPELATSIALDSGGSLWALNLPRDGVLYLDQTFGVIGCWD